MTSLVRAEPAAVPALKQWSDEQIEMATRSFAKDCDMAELEVFAEWCHRRGWDPWLGQAVAIKRGGKMIMQETIDAWRAVAERSGLYGGYVGPWWRTQDGPWDEVWLLDDFPAAAKILVIRKDWSEPAAGVAAWKSNAQFFYDRQEKKSKLVDIWRERPDEMLAKCAEVRALKRAFNKELGLAGLNVRDLTDAQVVTLEARRAGLDDDGRHQLIAEVTGGRTESSTELTDEETLEVRQEIARRAAEAPVEPADAEVVEEQPAAAAPASVGVVRRITQAGPGGQDAVQYVDTGSGAVLPAEVGEEIFRSQRIARIFQDRERFSDVERRLFDTYRTEKLGLELGTPAKQYTTPQLVELDDWLDDTLGEPF